MKYFIYLLLVFFFVSCGKNYVPKPKGYLRLDYPNPNYEKVESELPFYFEINKSGSELESKKIVSSTESYGINIKYPLLKGTIFLTYKSINANRDNLLAFLKDAQNLPQKHMIKADAVLEEGYENTVSRVYGMFYEVDGNAASQAQFYVTDSVNHFLTGSLYFYAKPNYDSILPAANYLQKDIKHIMETITWK
ncbi:gliding motility lipoprotein GldD [Pseudalgibacter alginicilyticus]|uniref:Gliding motility lipoprotein GldD n=1 Tax=Pseudalgibacter alginicilyticus TaxID=1736674 RepID=A0A0P0D6M5_9FLAO|nr:gliding motility lipoprotein GldD [Pseudalgibacter alginicilyticus]ALJ05785.1 gliding motility lipoprotein GldD [Pseudalgibacter alginicilyticus]